MIDLNEFVKAVFTIKNIIIYLLAINILTFIAMLWDKHEAKMGDWRISEKALFLLVLLGGGVGGIFGMYIFRHKTKKWYFKIGFPIILIIEIILGIYFFIK